MRRMQCCAALLMITWLAPGAACAGQNAQGVAWLSWDAAGTTTALRAVPTSAFPLYLHTRGAEHVTALAVTVRWAPFDSTSLCYVLASTNASDYQNASSDSICGVANPAPAVMAFGGDSTYTWSIAFPGATTARDLVVYTVAAPQCEEPPAADFVLSSAIAQDMYGALDTLTVIGGAGIAPDPVVRDVSPKILPPATMALLRIRGSHLAPGARVVLQGAAGGSEALAVASQDSTELVAVVATPDAYATPLDLLLEFPSGRTALVPDAVALEVDASSVVLLEAPTDDAEAFKRVYLRSRVEEYGQADGVCLIADGDTIPVYPDSLTGPTLLVKRANGDTMALFMSMANNGVGLESQHNAPQPAYVRYAVGGITASSIGVLMAGGINMGASGQWNDYGKSLVKIITYYDDASVARDSLRIGYQIRNYKSGGYWCADDLPFYTALPTDTVCTEVWSTTHLGTQ